MASDIQFAGRDWLGLVTFGCAVYLPHACLVHARKAYMRLDLKVLLGKLFRFFWGHKRHRG